MGNILNQTFPLQKAEFFQKKKENFLINLQKLLE